MSYGNPGDIPCSHDLPKTGNATFFFHLRPHGRHPVVDHVVGEPASFRHHHLLAVFVVASYVVVVPDVGVAFLEPAEEPGVVAATYSAVASLALADAVAVPDVVVAFWEPADAVAVPDAAVASLELADAVAAPDAAAAFWEPADAVAAALAHFDGEQLDAVVVVLLHFDAERLGVAVVV